MVRVLMIWVSVVAGAVSALGLADSAGWTAPIWALICPRHTMPSPAEQRAAATAARLEEVRREIARVEGELQAHGEKREALLRRLGNRLPFSMDAETDPRSSDILPSAASDDQVSAVLVLSVESVDEAGREINGRFEELSSQARSLEARLEAIQNGVDIAEMDPVPSGPVEAMRREDPATGEQRRRILEEARQSGEKQ